MSNVFWKPFYINTKKVQTIQADIVVLRNINSEECSSQSKLEKVLQT